MLFYQDIDMDNPPISNFFEVTSKQMSNRVKRTQLDYWEIGMLFKMFESYDQTKSKQITRESFTKLFKQLEADEADLGKVPNCTEEEFLSLFDALKGP